MLQSLMSSQVQSQESFLEQKYTYCYSDCNPQSLVMLSDASFLLPRLQHIKQQSFFWVKCDNFQSKQAAQILKRLEISTVAYSTLQQITKDLTENKNAIEVILIYPSKLTQSIRRLSNQSRVKAILCLQNEEEQDDQYFEFTQGENKINQCQDIEQLQEELQKFALQQCKQRFLPTFLFLKSEMETSNYLQKTISAMINQQLDRQVSSQISDHLNKIIKVLQSQNQKFKQDKLKFNSFIEQLKNSMTHKEAIKFYTQNSAIHILINCLCRSANYSTQLFCLQPYFKTLFNALKQLYQQQKATKSYFSAICYRGASITEEEVEHFCLNLGEVVQNLGFLSVSLSQEQTKQFIENVLFYIFIEGQLSQSGQAYQINGYAYVAPYSKFQEQQEIIFNPLNNFKIISVKQVRGHSKTYQIQLLLINSNHFQAKQREQMNKQQGRLKRLLEVQFEQKRDITSQGCIFQTENTSRNSFLYWQKFVQVSEWRIKKAKKQSNDSMKSEALKHKVRGLRQLAYNQIRIGQLKQAEKKYNEILPLAEELYGVNDINYCTLLKHIAQIKFKNREFQAAESLLLNALSKLKEAQSEQSKDFVKFLINLAIVQYQKGSHIQSQKHFLRALQLNNQASIEIEATILNGMAALQAAKKQFTKAYFCHLSALKLMQQYYGESNLKAGSFLLNLAQTLKKTKNTQKVLQAYFLILKRLANNKHALTVNRALKREYVHVLYCISEEFLKLGNKTKWESFISDAYKLVHMEQDQNRILQMCKWMAQNNLFESQLYSKLAVVQYVHGQKHSEYARLLIQITRQLAEGGHYSQKVLEFYEQAYENLQRISLKMLMLCSIANFLINRKQEVRCLDFCKNAMQTLRALQGRRQPTVITYLVQMGEYFEKLCQFSESIRCYQSALQLCKVYISNEKQIEYKIHKKISLVYLKSGSTKRAKSYLQSHLPTILNNSEILKVLRLIFICERQQSWQLRIIQRKLSMTGIKASNSKNKLKEIGFILAV